MSSRKKLTLSLTVVALVIVAAVVAVVGVLAATQQTVESAISITFTATDIDGSVSVRHAVKAQTATGIDSDEASEAGAFYFTAAGTTSGHINITPDAIEGREQALYVEYTFNRASVNYGVKVVFTGSESMLNAFIAEYYNGTGWVAIEEAVSVEGADTTHVLKSVGADANAATGTSVVLTRIRVNPDVAGTSVTGSVSFAFDMNRAYTA